MSEHVAHDNQAKPYKGPDSFQVEDADLFFGRDHDAERLIAQILSSRITLLHAPSGAGKTSLLNARIIPGLESRGWLPIRVLPQENPIASIKHETTRYVLPPPEAEIAAIRRAHEALGESGEDISVGQALERYDALEGWHADRRRLIAPIEIGEVDYGLEALRGGRFMPYFCRLLRSSIEVDTFADHLQAYLRDPLGAPPLAISQETRLADLLEALSAGPSRTSFAAMVAEINIPVPTLATFFQNLVETYGRRVSRFALVLLLDQFEELFTRFIDPGPGLAELAEQLPDWRLRWKLFDELERLYDTQAGEVTPRTAATAAGVPGSLLPIRYVISMRDEYIAQLDPLRRFMWNLDDSAYHLGFLEVNQARSAIEEPAVRFGYGYSPECLDEILAQLRKEARFVEPIHVQIVCEKVWNESGRALASQAAARGGGLPEIPLEAFRELGGAKGILASFLSEFLLGLDDRDRLQTLELMEPLITSAGTRNIVEQSQLVEVPFRNPRRRRRLLHKLQRRGIVRIERRAGGLFAEITHEFLIPPILAALRTAIARDPAYARFREALRTLDRFRHIDFRSDPSVGLMEHGLGTLHEFRHEVEWPAWAVELMYRSAIHLGSNEDVLREWGTRYAQLEPVADASSLIERLGRVEEGQSLGGEELAQINREREAMSQPREIIRAILEAELRLAGSGDEGDIEYWTRRVAAHEG